MSVDKKPSHHETLALIADKLAIERSGSSHSMPEPAAPKAMGGVADAMFRYRPRRLCRFRRSRGPSQSLLKQ